MKAMGIFSIVILVTANLLYFISAYYSFGIFRLRFISKIGARTSLHNIFIWMQFNNSMFKTDFGLILFFLMTSFLFNYENVLLLIFDCVVAVILFVNIYIMRISVKIF
jgi:hypothetical protein